MRNPDKFELVLYFIFNFANTSLKNFGNDVDHFANSLMANNCMYGVRRHLILKYLFNKKLYLLFNRYSLS